MNVLHFVFLVRKVSIPLISNKRRPSFGISLRRFRLGALLGCLLARVSILDSFESFPGGNTEQFTKLIDQWDGEPDVF
jgi:hypothetical protein